MLVRFAAMVCWFSWLPLVVAVEPFPYRAVVTSDELSVRSGPGESYYAVQKLSRGETVEVWRHDPGGWFAIRPPQGSFSWVASEFIRPTDDGLGVVIGERVVSRVGSLYSEIRDCVQVRLDKDEVVEILDMQRSSAATGPQSWYKISPPAGEFRWVQGRFVEPESRAPSLAPLPASSAAASNTPASAALSNPTANQPASVANPDTAASTDAGADKILVLERKLRELSGQLEQLTGKRSTGWTGKEGTSGEGRVLPDSKAKTIPEALNECELLLSQIVADDTLAWDFRQLSARVEELLSRAESAADRGVARALLLKIEKFEDIRQRYVEVIAQRNGIAPQPRSGVATRLARRIELKTDDGGEKYDGVGRLTQVVAQKPGAPQFALLDDDGQVLSYVIPAPGVNLRPYLDRDVGVTGILGILPEQNTRLVTAKRIEPLEVRKTR